MISLPASAAFFNCKYSESESFDLALYLPPLLTALFGSSAGSSFLIVAGVLINLAVGSSVRLFSFRLVTVAAAAMGSLAVLLFYLLFISLYRMGRLVGTY